MQTREQFELENAALANVLSRQLAHDISNFAYTVVLQLEIWERSRKVQQLDCEPLRRECRSVTGLLRQWEDFQRRSMEETPIDVDLHQVLQQVAGGTQHDVELAPAILAEECWISGPGIGIHCFLRLFVDDAFQADFRCEDVNRPTSIETEKVGDRVFVRIRNANCREADRREDGEPRSLVEETRESLAVRLDVTIHREQNEAGEYLVTLGFPLRVAQEQVPAQENSHDGYDA